MSNIFEDIPSTEPGVLRAGDFATWRRPDLGSTYPPADFDLSYAAIKEGDGTSKIEITGTADGDAFLVSVPSANSLAWVPGTYLWTAYITRKSDSERITVGGGKFIVQANLATSQDDPRSHARKMLDAIEALLENRATKESSSYEINGRKLTRLSPAELMDWRKHYRAEVARENRRASGKGTRQIRKVRFS